MTKRFLIFLLFFSVSILLVSCDSIEATLEGTDLPPIEFGDTVPNSNETSPQALLTVDPITVKPRADITLSGSGFPPNQIVLIYISDSEVNLGPALAQETINLDGEFETNLQAPIAWPGASLNGKSKLKVVVEDLYQTNLSSADIVLDYSEAFELYSDPSLGFSMLLPEGWEVSSPQRTPLGNLVLIGEPPLDPGNPGTSKLISVNQSELSDLEAAQLLACGEIGCDEDLRFSITNIGGLNAKQLTIGGENTPDIDWYFVNYEERLIYFTLLDPASLESLTPLINSFALLELPANVAEAEEDETPPASTAEATATDEPEEAAEIAALVDNDQDESESDISDTDAEPDISETEDDETPTPEAEETDEPEEEPTEPATETATTVPEPEEEEEEEEETTAEPTPSPEATEEPTVVPTRTPDVSVEEEPRESAFPPLPDPDTAGPLQTTINVLTILSRFDERADTLEYFSADVRQGFSSLDDLLPFMNLSNRPLNFDTVRIYQVPITVQATVEVIGGEVVTLNVFLVEEEERWRIFDVLIDGEGNRLPATLGDDSEAEASEGADTAEPVGTPGLGEVTPES